MSVIDEAAVGWFVDEERHRLEAVEAVWLRDEGRVRWLEEMHGFRGPIIEDGDGDGDAADGAGGGGGVGLVGRDLGGWRRALGEVRIGTGGTVGGLSEAGHLDLLRELEDLKAAAAGAQAVVTASFDQARRDREAGEGVAASRRGRGVGSEIALARRLSPYHGGRQLGLAKRIARQMPHTLAAMRAGTLSESRAGLVATETTFLTSAQRARLDEVMCADPDRIATWGDRRVAGEARKCAYGLSPEAMVQRCRRAESERHVSLRPAPDAMAYLTALLPASQALAVYQSLTSAADSGRAAGEHRGKGQLMADTLVERTTGQDRADVVPLTVHLVMSDHALFTSDNDQPATLPGYGLIPADWARELVATALADADDARTGAWLQRLYTHPDSGQLIAMDSRSRTAPQGMRDFIGLRDGATCRSPWCDAPIRHVDHITPHHRGGRTSVEELQGLCERCNYIKELPGWEAQLTQALDGPCDHRHIRPPPTEPPRRIAPRAGPPVKTSTPTGHSYTSRPPPPTALPPPTGLPPPAAQ